MSKKAIALEKRIVDLENWVHYQGTLFVQDAQSGSGYRHLSPDEAFRALMEHLGIRFLWDNPAPTVKIIKKEKVKCPTSHRS